MKKSHICIAILSLTASAFAQSSTETAPPPAAIPTREVAVTARLTHQAMATPPKAGLKTLPLQPTPATQEIIPSPEIAATSPVPPTAKVQTRKLSATDAVRLAAAERWAQTGAAEALVGASGAVEYPYGYSRPTITCAPLHVCSIALQDGEAITSISIGDTVRWLLQNATAGSKPVMMLKPTQAGLSTNLVVTTDKGRIYFMHLVSNKTEYVPMVSWYDPAAMTRDLSAEAQAAARQKAQFEATMAATKLAAEEARSQRVVADKSVGKLDPTTLDFGYTCSGEAAFKPARVFANDTHTFIQLPPGASSSDAPAVFNSSNNETELLNSRLVNGYYIIDGKPVKLSLVLGVGATAQTVRCERSVSNSLFKWGDQ